jgi:hypothetical protein
MSLPVVCRRTGMVFIPLFRGRVVASHNLEFKSRMKKNNIPRLSGLVLLLAMSLAPRIGWACACGCGVFDVGTGLMLPEGAGGMVYVNYDYQDQDHN